MADSLYPLNFDAAPAEPRSGRATDSERRGVTRFLASATNSSHQVGHLPTIGCQ